MADSNVAVVRDKEGRVHYAARESRFVVDGLADGSLEEVTDAGSSNAAAGDDQDTGRRRSGSGDRKRASSTANDSDK